MMALGQSPFMLMMQEGPQVVQALGQMRAAGVGLGQRLAQAFAMVMNPVSLATMAIIGFGAAAVQWLTRADEAAVSLGETIRDLSARVRDYRGAVDDALTPMSKLREEWGNQAGAIRDVHRALAELERLKALTALDAAQKQLTVGLSGIREAVGALDAGYAEVARRGVSALDKPRGQLLVLRRDFGLTEDQARRLVAAIVALENARGPEAVATATAALRREFMAVAAEAGRMPGPLAELAEAAIRAEL